MRTVLLTGAGGYLAGFLRNTKPAHVNLILQSRNNIPLKELEFFWPYPHSLENWMPAEHNPDIIIHNAAIASVDDCEINPLQAIHINVAYTKVLLRYANEIGAHFIYISSDQVFSGESPLSTEMIPPKPINFYGWTKWISEQMVLRSGSQNLIIRPALLYGPSSQGRSDFTSVAVKKLQSGFEVPAFIDQYRTPIAATDLAHIIWKASEMRLTGLIHAAGPQRLSRYDMMIQLCSVLKLPKNLIKPVSMKDVPLKALRGKDCSLNAEKMKHILHYKTRTFADAIRQYYL